MILNKGVVVNFRSDAAIVNKQPSQTFENNNNHLNTQSRLMSNPSSSQQALGGAAFNDQHVNNITNTHTEESPTLDEYSSTRGFKYWLRRIIIGKELQEYHQDRKKRGKVWKMFQNEGRRFLSEFFGTYILVLFVAGIQVLDIYSDKDTDVNLLVKGIIGGASLCFLIYSFGQISGAHLNPVVSLAFVLRGIFSPLRMLYYWVAQFAGAILAAGCLRWLFGNIANLGATAPNNGATSGVALGMEIILTFVLVNTILTTAERAKILGPMSAIAVGSCFAACLLFGWNVSGASMNPWRSFCPAIVSGRALGTIWIYFAGPIAGMFAAVLFQRVATSGRELAVVHKAARGIGVSRSDA
jgi:aquaporin Z